MSRGPGKLQRRILSVLEARPEHPLPRSALRQRFPDVDRANLRRAIRSLARMGRVYEHAEDNVVDPYTDEWSVHWVILVPPKPLSAEELDAILRSIWEQYE